MPPTLRYAPRGGMNSPATVWESGNTLTEGQALEELVECCHELEEVQRAWAAHRREEAWRLRRVEQ